MKAPHFCYNQIEFIMIVNIFLALGISIGLNAFAFFVSFLIKKDFLIDITYAITFVISSIVLMIIENNNGINQYLFLFLIIVWATRLGIFLLIRISKKKVDNRFDKIRNSFWKFGLFWMLQAVSIWVINMPTYLAIINLAPLGNIFTFLLALLALFFVAFETIADLQKYKFNQLHKGEFISIGLWKISRHPNYFGEICFWLVMTLLLFASDFQIINLIALVSPLWIGLLLYKISGVPILEKQGWKRFGNNPEYHRYLIKTPCVVPFIGKKGYYKNQHKQTKS